MNAFRTLFLNGAEIGVAHLPSDEDILSCLMRCGVPESLLEFKLANEFIAPGVFEQRHSVAGHSSTGAILEEEEERGAGSGACQYVFCIDRKLEIYLASYSGNGGEIAILVRADPDSAEICAALSAAMGIAWPTSAEGSRSRSDPDRITLHHQRLAAMRGHVQEWFSAL